MSRTHTLRNYSHPHYILKKFLEEMRGNYQRLPTAAIKGLIAKLPPASQPLPQNPCLHRHQMIDWIIVQDTALFKGRWKERSGWDFDDCYDEKKMQMHHDATVAREAEAKKQMEKPVDTERDKELVGEPYDATKIWTEDGEELSKEDFDKLDSPEVNLPGKKEAIRLYSLERMGALIRSGYVGMLNGSLVDRRWPGHEKALAVRAHSTMAPPPKPVPAAK